MKHTRFTVGFFKRGDAATHRVLAGALAALVMLLPTTGMASNSVSLDTGNAEASCGGVGQQCCITTDGDGFTKKVCDGDNVCLIGGISAVSSMCAPPGTCGQSGEPCCDLSVAWGGFPPWPHDSGSCAPDAVCSFGTCLPRSAQVSSGTAAIPQCVANGSSVTVVGPIPSGTPGDSSHDYPWLASDIDLASRGYVEEEYFICGVVPEGNYTTRLIVRRPKTASASNGAVLVEWLNDSVGFDYDGVWGRSLDHIMRAGYAYVGVSAQPRGIYASPNGLLAWSPERYAQLTIPQGNSLVDSNVLVDPTPASFSIFGQAMRAIKQPGTVDVMSGLPAKWIIATGVSQSAGLLIIYYNSFQTLDQVADGFLPAALSASSAMAGVGSEIQVNVNIPAVTAVVGKPFFLVNTETDPSFIRPPDSNLFRLWETAGTSHFDKVAFDYVHPLLIRDLGVDQAENNKHCQFTPRSRIPYQYVFNAAMDNMLAWVQHGKPPPIGQPFQYDSTGQLMRDGYGNVLGGIRLSQHEVATAVNRRENPGCELDGRYQPFDVSTLQSLYPTHAEYVSRVHDVTAQNLKSHYITSDDAKDTEAAAQAADVPPL